MSWPRLEQEDRLDEIFHFLEGAFKKLDKTKDETKRQATLKDITAQLKDAKTLIKDFERDARTDGMPARELADRKRTLVNEVNSYIALKKGYSSNETNRGELLSGAAEEGAAAGGNPYEGMTMQEMIKDGRRQWQETENTLNRAEKIVEDTLQIGQQTAATLHDQTQQLNKIVDDLDEIEFTMKKASKVIADIGKGIMTDRCIMFLLFLVVCGVIALVVVKVINPNKKKIEEAASAVVPLPNITSAVDSVTGQVTGAITSAFGQGSGSSTSSSPAPSGRRLMQTMLLEGLRLAEACC